MAKINIPTIRGGFNLSQINTAFQLIQTHLNTLVFYRKPPSGEPNEIEVDVDMDGNRLYNLPLPIEDNEPATKRYVDDKALDLSALESRITALEQRMTS